MSDHYQWTHQDCLSLLSSIDSDSIEAVIVDPPYSSGGFTRSDRNQSTAAKYVQSGIVPRADFQGDNRDARSWHYWCQLWMAECLRITKPSGYFLTFTDWRQLPTTTDAIQSAGFVWRGVIAWDKTAGARAGHTGMFRHQCEYIVWGTKGTSRKAEHGGPFPGCYRFPVKQSDKFHITGKPTALMRELVKIVPPGATVLDCFGGSATTGVGALMEGRRFIGCEQDQHYYNVGAERLAAATKGEHAIMEMQSSDVR